MSVIDAGDVDQRTDASAARYWAFASMWAIAEIVHLLNQSRGRLTSVFEWIALAAAMAVLAKPGDVRRLVGLSVAQLVLLYWQAPLNADHAMLVAFGNIILLFTYLWMRGVGRTAPQSQAPINGPALFARSRSALRLCLLIGYSAAALAKYNSSFFGAVGSCASELADIATFGLIDRTETALGPLHVAAAVIPETVIPILLIIPLTRRIGVRFGILFHFFVSLSPALSVRDFTAALFVFFPLFLADDEVADLVTRWKKRRDEHTPIRFHRTILDMPPRVRWGLFLLAAGAGGWVNEILHFFVIYIAFTVYGVRLLRLGYQTLRPLDRYPREPLISRIGIPQLLVVVLMFGYVLSPYVGLRTSSTFSMFSNLRTEGTATNHYFMPSVHLADYQTDMVVIVESNLDSLNLPEDKQMQLPRFEISFLLSKVDGGYVIERTPEGDVRLGDGGVELEPPSTLERKLLHFRPTAIGDATFCSN